MSVTRHGPAFVPRHSATGERPLYSRHPVGPAPSNRRRTTRADASPWNWLLLVPIVLPLLPFLYNRIEPTLFGIPFFYWCQLAFAFLASAVITIVHLKVR